MSFLYKPSDSRNWWVGWKANGRQYRKSTSLQNKDDAEKIRVKYALLEQTAKAGELTEAVIESFLAKPGPRVLLTDAMKDWLLECEGSTAPGTLARYKGIAQEFSEFVGVVKGAGPFLREIHAGQIREYLTAKRAKVSATTANLERTILKMFFRRSVANGLLRESPIEGIKFFKAPLVERTSRRPLTLQELDLIYRKAVQWGSREKDKPSNLFWQWMIMGGLYTGLRMGDLIRMRCGAIDFTENFIRLIAGKTNRPLQIPLVAPLRLLLEEVCKQAEAALKPPRKLKPADPLWPAEATRYERHGAKEFSKEFYEDILVPAGLVPARTHKASKKRGRAAKRETGGVSFHCLRHTFISFLKLTGSNNSVAKELAGHSSDAVNDLYTHLPVETLNAAMQRLPIAFPDPRQPGLPGLADESHGKGKLGRK